MKTVRIITLANLKGGVGKTTVAVNLAVCLAAAGERVLVVDADPQGNCTQAMGVNPDSLSSTLFNVLVGRILLSKVVIQPIESLADTLHLCPSNLDLSEAELKLAGTATGVVRLRQAIEGLAERYEFVIVDSPPSLALLTVNALVAADEVMVPVDSGAFSLRGVGKLLNSIEDVRSVNPKLNRVRALLNKTDGTNLSAATREELSRVFGHELYQTGIRRSVRIGEAQSAGIPLPLFRPKDPASNDFVQLAQEVTNG